MRFSVRVDAGERRRNGLVSRVCRRRLLHLVRAEQPRGTDGDDSVALNDLEIAVGAYQKCNVRFQVLVTSGNRERNPVLINLRMALVRPGTAG